MKDDSDGTPVYERISLMRPRQGERERALSLLGELIEFYSGQPGYIEAYTLVSPEDETGSSFCGITLWQDRACADRAAALEQARALRDELAECLVEGSNVERGFSATHEPLVAGSR